ncbi:hypothetical protein SNE40_013594 [Patella caerulea]|uniref:Uncharacterized protein n=1 Tax=Patella caerulea TaxID=87958 RepID=A0AAN8JG99_PATCE
MFIVVLISAILVGLASSTPCSSSVDCPTGSSCRDENGHIIYIPENQFGPIFDGPNEITGTCGEGAGAGEVCLSTPECPPGYECYREMSGACCPPKRCITNEEAQEKRDYWNNCHPPTCFFPAK